MEFQLLWCLSPFLAFYHFLFFSFFSLKKQISREKKIQRKIFLTLVHSPSVYNGQSWTNPNPRAQSFFQISHVGSGFQGFGPLSAAFPQTGSWMGSRAVRRWTNTDMGSRHVHGEDLAPEPSHWAPLWTLLITDLWIIWSCGQSGEDELTWPEHMISTIIQWLLFCSSNAHPLPKTK